MPLYAAQVAYTTEAWQALLRNPQDRLEAVRPAIEKLGGKLVNGWFVFGDYDVLAVIEMPCSRATNLRTELSSSHSGDSADAEI